MNFYPWTNRRRRRRKRQSRNLAPVLHRHRENVVRVPLANHQRKRNLENVCVSERADRRVKANDRWSECDGLALRHDVGLDLCHDVRHRVGHVTRSQNDPRPQILSHRAADLFTALELLLAADHVLRVALVLHQHNDTTLHLVHRDAVTGRRTEFAVAARRHQPH